jgi:hypothetical protein
MLFLMTLLAGFFSACGGEEEGAIDEPLTIEEYATAVTKLQDQSRSEFNASSLDISQPGLDPSAQGSLDFLAEYHDLAIREGDRFFAAVGFLSPPIEIMAAHSGFVSAWPSYREHLKRTRDLWATSETFDDVADELTTEMEAIARNPFEDACIALENAVGEEGFATDFGCDVDWVLWRWRSRGGRMS